MNNLKLRKYQKDCLRAIQENKARGVSRQLISMATGSGKTVCFGHLIQQLQCKSLVLAHTHELLEQARDKFSMITPELSVGLFCGKEKEIDSQVVIASVQSAAKDHNLSKLVEQDFELCIVDEAHRAGAHTYRNVLDKLGFGKGTKKLLVGFTATPSRNDNRGLGCVFDQIVFKKTIKQLINEKYLCKPVGVRIKTDLDLETVKTEDGDYVSTSLASVMNTPEMNRIVVDAYIERAMGRKTVCFAVNILHAQNLSTAFKSRGINSEAIYGSIPCEERASLLDRFERNEIKVLVNCQMLVEGWDSPEVDCVLIAKPTQSKVLYQQMCGRGLRLYPNKKDCLILDFGSKTHSLCSASVLVGDSEPQENIHKTQSIGRMSDFVKALPSSLNKKLRASILEFDPLGNDFQWIQEGQTFTLKAIGNKALKIFPTAEGRFSVIFFNGSTYQRIVEELSFEYAFSSAEQFAHGNRSLFTVSDLEANWRCLPISEKQKNIFTSRGYRSGIDELSRGQAAVLIASGVLNRKAARD